MNRIAQAPADERRRIIDPRAQRCWQLLATINGWPPVPGTAHLWSWFSSALRAHA